ncbi:MAG TPA: FHA domain-containing serine/threonine-protein kinase [Candidatus Brocadiia bacterium]|nr:FHA domain-containing serine/threonine-protein kinase [Candidatus Brocadiia bacterium]
MEVGAARGKVFEILEDRPFYAGRDPKCEACIPSANVSRRHFKIEGRLGAFSVTDLNSRHGTFVNNEKITSRPLRHGDIIFAGGNRLRFDLEQDEKEAAKPVQGRPSAGFAVPAPKGRLDSGSEQSRFDTAQDAGPVVGNGGADEEGLAPLRLVEPDTELGAFLFSERDVALMGKTLGEYRVLEPLGKGRRTVIYLASRETDGQEVAIKVLRTRFCLNADMKAWFVKGAQRASAIRHEDIARVLAGGKQDEHLFLAMERMEVNAWQRFRGVLKEGLGAVKQALQAATMISRALEHGVNEWKMLHGGIRPSKILFDANGQAKLAGMGFDNRPKAPGAVDDPALKPFQAPEVAKDPGTKSVAAEIYALGASFYYMLTGQAPALDSKDRPRSPRDVNPNVPDSLVRIVEKAMAPSPADRYEGYAQLLHDLRWALRGEIWHRG